MGVTGLRGEHLRVLARDFEYNAAAAKGATEFSDFATRIANGEPPRWFYALLTINRLVMPVKKLQLPGAAADCRPVGVPQPDRCCI